MAVHVGTIIDPASFVKLVRAAQNTLRFLVVALANRTKVGTMLRPIRRKALRAGRSSHLCRMDHCETLIWKGTNSE